MNIFQRLRRRRSPYAAVNEEEQIARYVYLLNTLPASVIESAHATAFRTLPAEKRREMFASLRPFMAESERDVASDDPTVLARLIRRAEERKRRAGQSKDAATAVATLERDEPPGETRRDPRDDIDSRAMLMRSGVLSLVAYQFVLSASVSTYFTYGAGALMLGDQPGWVGDMVDPGAGGGGGDYGGGGFDGGGFGGGGFDGGGFGGGFDGGGGFG